MFDCKTVCICLITASWLSICIAYKVLYNFSLKEITYRHIIIRYCITNLQSMLYAISLSCHHQFGNCHPETIVLPKKSILNNNYDLVIWLFNLICNPTLGYPLTTCTCNFHTNPSTQIEVTIPKLKHFQTLLFWVTVTLIFDLSAPYSIPLCYPPQLPMYQRSYKSITPNWSYQPETM